ncbi:unnamed protein product [Ranitomeya imitator]|uniref:Ubiquitin-activating enzyme E1 C-terminal domain-containing protein n=1 Tax=Ranitomeya imitator TaxID=111125 RepID=A0ABN9MKG7_9NEOB|nr:unnamed protein product [Ranitomeya imitator]
MNGSGEKDFTNEGLQARDQYSLVLKAHDQYSLVLKAHDQYSLVLRAHVQYYLVLKAHDQYVLVSKARDQKALVLKAHDQYALVLKEHDQYALVLKARDQYHLVLRAHDQYALVVKAHDQYGLVLKAHDQYALVLKAHDQYALVLKAHDQYVLDLKVHDKPIQQWKRCPGQSRSKESWFQKGSNEKSIVLSSPSASVHKTEGVLHNLEEPPGGSSIHPRSVSPNEWLGEKDFTLIDENKRLNMYKKRHFFFSVKVLSLPSMESASLTCVFKKMAPESADCAGADSAAGIGACADFPAAGIGACAVRAFRRHLLEDTPAVEPDDSKDTLQPLGFLLLAITVTDPDLIEKSNLNRQFLFRPYHIQKPKSCTAAAVTLGINPQLKIEPRLDKVCPATENIYTDDFYTKQDIIVTALDNVEARRYVDSRSVSNMRPLLDSGTMGTKGHTEIIVPCLTESYNSYRDPPDEEIPFCTLKSFPATIEHTIQWARDKFESSFTHKPSLYSKFWQTHSTPQDVLRKMKSCESLEGCFHVVKLLSRKPRCWSQCVELARLKFEKYFDHKAQQLLHSFPLDTRLKDGSLFWQSPKRPPTPIEFDIDDQLHISFILSAAKLFAEIYSIKFTEKDLSLDMIKKIISEVNIKEFTPSNKIVETDENAKKPDQMPVSSEDERLAVLQLERVIAEGRASQEDLQMKMLSFEKDDDRNEHINFITAASNLRAKMYSIEPADRLKTKRIAGKIIPAIATATAAVSGLVALELIKVVGGHPFEAYKNCFFNLAIPIIVFTETAEVKRTPIRNGISFTIWDRWTIYGKEEFTLLDFINAVKEHYGIEPTMVVQGVKMLYIPVMPGHAKRLKLTMHKLVKAGADRKYVDLTVSFAPEADEDEELPGPPVRYYFNKESN